MFHASDSLVRSCYPTRLSVTGDSEGLCLALSVAHTRHDMHMDMPRVEGWWVAGALRRLRTELLKCAQRHHTHSAQAQARHRQRRVCVSSERLRRGRPPATRGPLRQGGGDRAARSGQRGLVLIFFTPLSRRVQTTLASRVSPLILQSAAWRWRWPHGCAPSANVTMRRP